MLVWEEIADFVNVLLFVNKVESFEQIAVFKLLEGDSAVVSAVQLVENPVNDRIGVPVLELWSLLKELKSRVNVKEN